MMFAFFFAGVFLLIVSLRELLRRWWVLPRMERAEGSIVELKRKTMNTTTGHRRRSTVMYFPVITFPHVNGAPETFTAEIGDSGATSRYAIGQKINVLYDPDGDLPAMIDSWSGIWLPNIMAVFAGAMFIFGSWMIYYCFADKIFGK